MPRYANQDEYERARGHVDEEPRRRQRSKSFPILVRASIRHFARKRAPDPEIETAQPEPRRPEDRQDAERVPPHPVEDIGHHQERNQEGDRISKDRIEG